MTAFDVTQFKEEVSLASSGAGFFDFAVRGHHQIDVALSTNCNCREFEFRQFIRGTVTVQRGAITEDRSRDIGPVGGIGPQFSEDIAPDGQRYGHREEAGQAKTTPVAPENHYTNEQGITDQAGGCKYRGEDFPKFSIGRLESGDVVRVLMQFRGQILRHGPTDGAAGTVVQTREWTDIDQTINVP